MYGEEETCRQISCRVTQRQETNIKNSDRCKLAKNSDGKKVVLNRYRGDVCCSFSFTKMLNTQQIKKPEVDVDRSKPVALKTANIKSVKLCC
jgi:glucose dehydrogenase